MPVHRPPGSARGTVFVTIAELEAWRNSSTPPPPEVVAPRNGRKITILSGASLLILMVIGSILWARWHGPNPASARVEGNRLLVSDAQGRLLWEKTFEDGLLTATYGPAVLDPGRFWRFVDVDADGQTEVLFSYWPPDYLSHGVELHCYSRAGDLKWRFIPGRPVSTRVERFAMPFGVRVFAPVRLGPGRGTALVVASTHILYYSSQVAVLSGSGKVLREYWHSGLLEHIAVHDWNNDGADEVYLGGINNARHCATVAALDPRNLDGAGQENNLDYQLQGFPPPTELARIFFPRSCANRKLQPYNSVHRLSFVGDQMVVSVQEGPSGSEAGGLNLYHFSRDLHLQSFSIGDTFREFHAHLYSSNQIDHPLNSKEESDLREVQAVKTNN